MCVCVCVCVFVKVGQVLCMHKQERSRLTKRGTTAAEKTDVTVNTCVDMLTV